MKILFVNSTKFWGGAEKWHVAAASFLHKSGFDVKFICRGEPVAERLRQEGVKYSKLPFFGDVDIFSFFGVLFKILFFRPDVIIMNNQRDLRLAGLAAMIARVKVRLHRMAVSGIKDKPIYRFTYQRIVTNVICVANSILDDLSQIPWIGSEKLKALTNGVEIDKFDPTDSRGFRKELKLADDDILLGSVCRLSGMKGLDILFRALFSAIKKNDKLKLVIVGEGDRGDELKQLARELGLDAHITFAGFRNDVPQVLRSIDIFLLPSVSTEGMPNSLLEAFAAGRASIASDIAGTPEIIDHGKNGLLVPIRDVEALEKAILELAGNEKKRNTFKLEARKTAEEKFSHKGRMEELKAYLEELVKR